MKQSTEVNSRATTFMLQVIFPFSGLDVFNDDLVDGGVVGEERGVGRRLVVILSMQHIVKLSQL